MAIDHVPSFCVFVGANGSVKTTLFNVFVFLKDALADNIHVALTKQGGSKGFAEVRSRGADVPIEIELKFRERPDSPLVMYSLAINEKEGREVVEREILQYRRGSKGQPWRFLDFAFGKGDAVINEPDEFENSKDLRREAHTLKSPDILALKGLAQFEKFPASMALGELLENWHVSDLHIQQARQDREEEYAEHLSKEGENLSWVSEYLYTYHRPLFDRIIEKLKLRVPGISMVEAKTTEEGQVFVSTHSPEFLNACNLSEVFWLAKKNGYSTINRAADDPQIKAYLEHFPYSEITIASTKSQARRGLESRALHMRDPVRDDDEPVSRAQTLAEFPRRASARRLRRNRPDRRRSRPVGTEARNAPPGLRGPLFPDSRDKPGKRTIMAGLKRA